MIAALKTFAALGNWIIECGRIGRYLASGRRPWTTGYEEYKQRAIRSALNDDALLAQFRMSGELAPQYGYRIDERIIEYPWVLSRLEEGGRGFLLDAGSTLAHPFLQGAVGLRDRSVVVYDLAINGVLATSHARYIRGDLRQIGIRTASFDQIICISTLEHVGMNNAFLYAKHPQFNENRPNDYSSVMREFARLLRPQGRLLMTVPYGQHEDHGWWQQFDRRKIAMAIRDFGASEIHEAYYKYSEDGWQVADADDCSACRYFDIHRRREYDADYAAAARAVACIELVK